MVCISNCLLATIMGASFLMSILAGIILPIKNNLNFDKEQEKMYKQIVQTRLHIFLIALATGLIVSGILISLINADRKNKVCIFIFSSILILNIVYLSIPKKKWIIKDLNLNQKQLEAWLNIYKGMKIKKIVALVVGAVLYLMFSYIFIK